MRITACASQTEQVLFCDDFMGHLVVSDEDDHEVAVAARPRKRAKLHLESGSLVATQTHADRRKALPAANWCAPGQVPQHAWHMPSAAAQYNAAPYHRTMTTLDEAGPDENRQGPSYPLRQAHDGMGVQKVWI